ncbi:RNA-binding protein ['Osedax' symbiont bacterium Rs2_46_30_T18]|nr:RNA-binding protein ['Osedax' symbiont bacterium Rs2_46_30_T18]
MKDDKNSKIRLDKWLWAARFFKTRALAKKALEGGKVQYDGQRSKSSKLVEIGAIVKVRQGWDERIVEILALSDQRRGAPQAALLFRETEQSIKKREYEAEQRKILKISQITPAGKPDKRDRRRIVQNKDLLLGD